METSRTKNPVDFAKTESITSNKDVEDVNDQKVLSSKDKIDAIQSQTQTTVQPLPSKRQSFVTIPQTIKSTTSNVNNNLETLEQNSEKFGQNLEKLEPNQIQSSKAAFPNQTQQTDNKEDESQVDDVTQEAPLLESHSEKLDLVKSDTTSNKQNESKKIKSNLVVHKTSTSSVVADTTGLVDRKSTITIPEPDIQENLLPGVRKTVLEEHGFTIGKQIGCGTYAKVKIAYSNEFKGPVAIKIISKMKAPHEYLSKFLPREIDVVRGLRHDNLIRFYQSIETTHRVYIIMQFAERGSLLDLIRQSGYLSDSSAKKYFRQLASAIEYCHSQGVVHRDIKCENLLLDKDSNLKVIDFGFARRHMKPMSNNSRSILSETYCGSYAYASPEVLRGTPYDPHFSDIWAVGVVLFAMVYGRLPFDGSNYHQLLKQVQSKLVFPKTPNVSTNCKNLLNKILAPLKIRCSFRQVRQDAWYNQVQ